MGFGAILFFFYLFLLFFFSFFFYSLSPHGMTTTMTHNRSENSAETFYLFFFVISLPLFASLFHHLRLPSRNILHALYL